jgi:hypothetical protein
MYDTIMAAIAKLGKRNTEVLCHYPLARLIADWSILDEQEKAFASSPLTHIDFLIYNTLTKQPLQAIEVDGWHFHKENEAQHSRDTLKDRILAKFELCPRRISTTAIVTVETIMNLIEKTGDFN